MEYLIVLTIIMLLLLPIWVYISSSTTQSSFQLRVAKAKFAATRIADAADFVFVQGPPAKTEVFVDLPEGTGGVNFFGREVAVTIRSYRNSTSDAIATSLGEMQGNVQQWVGVNKVILEATETGVNISGG